MSLTIHDKQEIVNKFKISKDDTGSPEVQVSLMTARIAYLTDNCKKFRKDNHSKCGLQRLVNQQGVS